MNSDKHNFIVILGMKSLVDCKLQKKNSHQQKNMIYKYRLLTISVLLRYLIDCNRWKMDATTKSALKMKFTHRINL